MALLPDIAGLVLAFTIGLVGEALPNWGLRQQMLKAQFLEFDRMIRAGATACLREKLLPTGSRPHMREKRNCCMVLIRRSSKADNAVQRTTLTMAA
jgi:hypothetical protein